MKELLEIKVAGNILCVSPPWLGKELHIYERQSCIDLHKIIWEDEADKQNIIVPGTPGIGKSCFAL